MGRFCEDPRPGGSVRCGMKRRKEKGETEEEKTGSAVNRLGCPGGITGC